MFQFDQVKDSRSLFSLAKRPLKVGGIFLFLVLFLWGGVSFFFAPKPFDTLSGTLYLTLAPQGEKVTDLYQFDVKTHQFTKMFDDNFIKYTGKFSPSGEKMAFASALLDRSSTFFLPSKEFLQIKVYDRNTGVITKLTDINTLNKRIGGWSPDGKNIAFTSQAFTRYPNIEEAIKSFYKPDNWSLDTVDVDGKTEHIDAGTNSVWSPDGTRLLFLKNDGLYIRALSGEKSEKVYSLSEQYVATNMKLGLSHDGRHLALGFPNKNQLLIFEILSWNPFSSKLVSRIMKEGKLIFWPVFSPDDRYIVFQEVDFYPDHSQTLLSPRLVAYDTVTSRYLELANLDQYNFNFAFIDDWR